MSKSDDYTTDMVIKQLSWVCVLCAVSVLTLPHMMRISPGAPRVKQRLLFERVLMVLLAHTNWVRSHYAYVYFHVHRYVVPQ